MTKMHSKRSFVGNRKSNSGESMKPAFKNLEKHQKPSNEIWIGNAIGDKYAGSFKSTVPDTLTALDPELGWEQVKKHRERKQTLDMEDHDQRTEVRQQIRSRREREEEKILNDQEEFKNLYRSDRAARRQITSTKSIDYYAVLNVYLNQESPKQNKSPGFLAVSELRSRQTSRDYDVYEHDDDLETKDSIPPYIEGQLNKGADLSLLIPHEDLEKANRDICLEMVKSSDRKAASLDLDFDHLVNIFAHESFSHKSSRVSFGLGCLAMTGLLSNYSFPGLENINLPALFGEWSKIRFGKTDVGSNMDMSISPPTLEHEMHLQLRQFLQMLKTHVYREKSQMPSVEKNTECEISRASSEEVSTDDSLLWGRQRLNNWKLGAGRAHSWKTGHLTKALTQRKRAKCDRNNVAIRAVRYRCALGNDELGQSRVQQADLPMTALRSSKLRLAKSPNLKWRYTKILDVKMKKTREKVLLSRVSEDTETRTPAEDNMDSSSSEIYFPDTSSWLIQENEERSQHYNSCTAAARPDPENLCPVFNFSGQLLCFPYRLMEHLRTEPHGEVYNIKDLDSGILYQAKVYILRGIDRNQRKRRVENLKRVTALPSFVRSFNYGGQKYCLFEHEREKRVALASKLGAIGRLNSLEYKMAFPPLLLLSASSPVDLSPMEVEENTKMILEMVTGQFYILKDPALVTRARQIMVQELSVPSDRRNTSTGSVPLLLRIMNRLSDKERALVSAHTNLCSVERRQGDGPEPGTPSLSAGAEAVEVFHGQDLPRRKGRKRRNKRRILW